jgi:uncharacterized protein YndB with AHSA1/START domain
MEEVIMAKIKASIWLNAKPEEVWPFLVEPEKLGQWLKEIQHVEWPDEGPIGAGSRCCVNKEIRGQVRRYDTVVTRWEENRVYGFTSEAPGFSRVDGEWVLAPEGAGCRFTLREQISTQAGWLIDRLFVQPSARRAVREFQVQLKRLVERGA